MTTDPLLNRIADLRDALHLLAARVGELEADNARLCKAETVLRDVQAIVDGANHRTDAEPRETVRRVAQAVRRYP